jgi:hypothetical protein
MDQRFFHKAMSGRFSCARDLIWRNRSSQPKIETSGTGKALGEGSAAAAGIHITVKKHMLACCADVTPAMAKQVFICDGSGKGMGLAFARGLGLGGKSLWSLRR